MICKILLFLNGASSNPATFYVESTSKELALNALVLKNKINLNSYKLVLVIDLTIQMIIDDCPQNLVNAMIDNDHNSPTLDLLLDYSQPIFT